MRFFALRNKPTGRFMTVEIESNQGAPSAPSHSAFLMEASNDDIIWMTNDFAQAVTVSESNPAWFESGIRNPQNGYVGQLEVVELFTI